ncbi:hypothetical protein GGS20DRAFT_547073 [Poronia punctata]|nr:hypothetical protein GGS20DRAFT_547073 [Poronia punctata]
MDKEVLNMREDSGDEFVDMLGPQAACVLAIWRGPDRVQKAAQRSNATLGAQQEVREWYNKICILSSHSWHTQAPHILPNSIERFSPSMNSLLNTLKCFWPRTEVDKLRKLLADPAHERRSLLVKP